MISPLIVPKTFAQLREIANPTLVAGGESEAIPFILYDTQLYDSGATTVLNFFQSQQADPTLSNMLQGGALTDPQWFEIYNLGVDVLAGATSTGEVAATAAGILNDIQLLMLVGRPVFTLTISDKNYGQAPLSFLHTSGGAQGVAAGAGVIAAGTIVEAANNSFPDGGWDWRGSVVIPPKVGFGVRVQWTAAQTLAYGDAYLRFWMAGCLHRRVL